MKINPANFLSPTLNQKTTVAKCKEGILSLLSHRNQVESYAHNGVECALYGSVNTHVLLLTGKRVVFFL